MLREQATALTNAITLCSNQVAIALLEKDLISGKILPTTGVPPNDKARGLVTDPQFSHRGQPRPVKYLSDACQVLHNQEDKTLGEIANSIQQNLGK